MPTFLSNASFALVDATLGFRHGTTATPLWKTGTGTPEGVVAAPVGSLYSRLDGGTDTAVYRKETGTGNTGWVATSSAIAGVSSVDGRTGTVTLSDLYVDIAGDTMTGNLGMGVTPTSKLHFVASTTAAGGIQFGSDTNIYRSAVDTLRTDDSLSVGVRVDATSGFRHGSSTTPSWTTGTGTPEGVVTAPIGSLFSRTDGSTGTAVYRKESGVGNTGWVAVSTASGVASVDGRTGVVTLSDLYVDVAGDNMTGNLGLGAPGPTAKLQFAADTTAVGGILFGTDTTLYRSGPDVLQTDDAFKSAGRIEAALSTTTGGFRQGPAGPMWVSGSGTPEGAVTAPVGSLYSRTNGSANTTLYRKESGTLSTGWIATSSAGVSSVDGRNGTVVLSDLYVDVTGDTMTGELHAPVVSVGIASATAGQIRLSNDDTIQARNAANSADLVMLTASVNNYVQVGANGQVGVAIGSGTGRTLWVAATSNPTTAAGGITFGTSADTNLYRSAADTLKTDDSLVVGVRVDATSGFRHGSALLPSWTSGAGTPEAVVTAPIGSLFSRTDGSTGTAVYRKEVGTGNTGWVAASSSAGGVTSVDGRTGVVTLSDLYVDVAGDTMTGNLGMGVTPTSKLHFAAATTTAGGIQFGSDTNLYRGAPDTLQTDDTVQVGGTQAVNLAPTGRAAIAAPLNDVQMLVVGATGGSNQFNSAITVAGVTSNPLNAGTGSINGVISQPCANPDTGTVSALCGGSFSVRLASATAIVTSGRALYASAPSIAAGGIVTTAFGLDIAAQAVTGATNAYGIYQRGANDNNYFGGRVAIGSTDFSYALHVNRASGVTDGNAQAQRIYHSWTTTADTSGTYLSGLGVTMSVSNSAGNTFTNPAGESISGISGVGLVTGAGTFSTSVNGVTATISKYSTSTLSTGRAVNATSPNIVGGTIATATGVEIGSQKVTGVTTGYGIYQRGASDLNYFAGQVQSASFRQGSAGPMWQSGAGSPEGVISAPVGSIYSRTDGGVDTALYRKETGAAATGWVPIADVYVATSAPAGTPNSGDLWYDTDETSASIPIPLTIANGGTSASTAAAARSSLSIPFAGNSASTAGAPTSGTYVRGDYWLDSNSVLWVCTIGGTPGTWTSSNSGEELAYNQITANVTVSSTTAANPNLVIEGTSRSYDGGAIIVEFCSSCLQTNATVQSACLVGLWDSATDLGYLADVFNGSATNIAVPVYARRRIVPTVGTHNYRAVAWVNSGAAATVFAGSPGGTFGPAFIRVTRA
jgi:hypothetical protein